MKKEYYEAYEDRYKDAYDNNMLWEIKDLGKKCFAITKILDNNILKELLNKPKKCYEED